MYLISFAKTVQIRDQLFLYTDPAEGFLKALYEIRGEGQYARVQVAFSTYFCLGESSAM
jgi:hypothetical protein